MTGIPATVQDSTATGAFGAMLRRHRNSLAWSQEDLAEASRVAARTISDLERGVAVRPRSATVRLLAQALELSGDDLAAFRAAARSWRLAGAPTAVDPRPLSPSQAVPS
jgi:transcriptional regulator with XRE-family HTH domain